MSRRQTVDYITVFKELLKAMPGDVALEEAILDFEQATWLGLQNVFPDIDIFGYHFHYTHAIYKKVQKLGLGGEYQKDEKTRQLIKMMFGLPFLPLREMMEEFVLLRDDFAGSGDQMSSMYNYIARTWFEISVWKPLNICAF